MTAHTQTHTHTNTHMCKHTDLTDVGGGRESEGVSMDVEGDFRQSADVVTVHHILRKG